MEEGPRPPHLGLNPVDEMVSCYGRALQVLSGRWPVLDGDEPVGPHRAMLEASRVVAEEQMRRVAGGSSLLSELAPEAAMAALLLALFGLNDFSYDEGLNLSRSLNISLENRSGGYLANGRFIGVNGVRSGRACRSSRRGRGVRRPPGSKREQAVAGATGGALRQEDGVPADRVGPSARADKGLQGRWRGRGARIRG